MVPYSVGIPVRNEENTIIRTLESILAQTIIPREILVCVNGSTDNTYYKVSDMAIAEHRINLLTSAPGKANAWNKIVSESPDNTMMFCDGDVVINPEAANNMIQKFSENPGLILVGGTNVYAPCEYQTTFLQYFTTNLRQIPAKQDWVSGGLYMIKRKELFNLAKNYQIEMMPTDVINEDAFLGMVTKEYREIIDSAYILSMPISTFYDWRVGFKRILAGQKQLRERYPQHFKNPNRPPKSLKYYISRFNKVEGLRRKMGVTSLFILRTALETYYRHFDGLDYNPVWKETRSTKVEIKGLGFN